MTAQEETMEEVECVIVGGGISGICMAAQLLKSGRTSFLLLEKSGEIGGTWASNRYPGCRCDVPSYLYSYSFWPSPNWTQSYATRPEIQSYIYKCAKELHLLPYVRFHTKVERAVWEEGRSGWRLEVSSGKAEEVVRARFLIRATGPGLQIPSLPSVPGVSDNSFVGTSFHSSQWDPDHIDVTDKTVAVIGTGASSVQIVPSIAPIAKHVFVCQRTPAWVLPVLHFSIPDSFRRFFRHSPFFLLLIRSILYLFQELLIGPVFFGFLMPFFRFTATSSSRLLLRSSISDPSIRSSLTPSYPIGCKRVLLSNSFYAAFARPNVSLLAGRLTEVRNDGIVVTENATGKEVEAKVDVIVYATGFDTCASPFEVLGRGGRKLKEEGQETMLGIVKKGFPNFFMVLGPNTFLGHTSVILMAEAQARYIASCVEMMMGGGAMEVKEEAQERFQEELDGKFPTTVWRSGNCRSYYVHPESGRNHLIWPSSTLAYFRRTQSVSVADYDFTPPI